MESKIKKPKMTVLDFMEKVYVDGSIKVEFKMNCEYFCEMNDDYYNSHKEELYEQKIRYIIIGTKLITIYLGSLYNQRVF